MTALFFLLLGASAGAIGGSLGTHRWHRCRTANAELRAAMFDNLQDIAGQLVDQSRLRRPRKRHIPAGHHQ